MSVKYDSNAKRILNVRILQKNLDQSNHLIASDISTIAKNDYIPVVSGKLRRSTIISSPSSSITIANTIYYALNPWYNAKEHWRSQWFIKIVNVKRNITRWENIIVKRWSGK